MTHQTDVDVLIIGAGPTGLTMACLLAQFGVKFRIIDKNSAISEHSKALGVQARTLELFEQFGITEKAVAQGWVAKGLDLVVQGKLKASISLDSVSKEVTRYPYILILEQCKTEQLLLDKLNLFGKNVEWQKELVELQQQAHSVMATLTHRERIEQVRAKYLIAADGAKSTVRALLHMPFIGGTYENRFLLSDIAMEGPVSREHVTLCLSRQGFAGFFPMAGLDRFRVVGMLPEKMPTSAVQDFSVLAKEVRRQARMELKISDPLWISTYKIHHRAIMRFRQQQCFLLGDAAHVHSPVGAQGMNTGVQDSFNLAWKLHLVLTHRAHEKILETYHEERYPVAQKLIFTTDRIFGFITNRGFIFRNLRILILPTMLKFLLKNSRFQNYVFRIISQTAIRYRKSSLSEQSYLSEAKFKVGDRACHVPVNGNFQALIVGDPRAQEQVAILLEKYLEGRVQVHTLNKNIGITGILQDFGIHRDGLILIRPDGYTCYCAEGLDVGALKNYLDRFFISRDLHLQKDIEDKEGFPFESFI